MKLENDSRKWWDQPLADRLENLNTLPETGNGYDPIRPSETSMTMAKRVVEALTSPCYVITADDGMIVFEWFLKDGKRLSLWVEPENKDNNLTGWVDNK